MRKVRHALDKEKTNYDHVMLWAAYCTAFFGFEVREARLAAYDPGTHLSYGDITFNSQTHPTLAQVSIRHTGSLPCNIRIRGRSIFLIQRGHSLVKREDDGEEST